MTKNFSLWPGDLLANTRLVILDPDCMKRPSPLWWAIYLELYRPRFTWDGSFE